MPAGAREKTVFCASAAILLLVADILTVQRPAVADDGLDAFAHLHRKLAITFGVVPDLRLELAPVSSARPRGILVLGWPVPILEWNNQLLSLERKYLIVGGVGFVEPQFRPHSLAARLILGGRGLLGLGYGPPKNDAAGQRGNVVGLIVETSGCVGSGGPGVAAGFGLSVGELGRSGGASLDFIYRRIWFRTVQAHEFGLELAFHPALIDAWDQ